MFEPSTFEDNPETTNPTAKVLRDAADYIREHGWHQGCAEQGGKVCILGAIWALCNKDDGDVVIAARPAEGALFDYFRINNIRGVAEWNDAPERTKEEVIAALEGAAASVEASA